MIYDGNQHLQYNQQSNYNRPISNVSRESFQNNANLIINSKQNESYAGRMLPAMTHQTKSDNIERERINKTNNYKQELLQQINFEKQKKEEEKRRLKQIEEDEERKVAEYWNRKKDLLSKNQDSHKNKFYKESESKYDSRNNGNNANPNNIANVTNMTHTVKDDATLQLDHSNMLNETYRANTINYSNTKRDNENSKNDTFTVPIEQFKPPPLDSYMRQKLLKDELNSQIHSLRKDVSKQTQELSGYISNLKNEVKEANRLKLEAEMELFNIRDHVDKKRVTDSLFEQTFKQIIERHAPYNNLHIPMHEVHPTEKRKRELYGNQKEYGRLDSQSEFLYENTKTAQLNSKIEAHTYYQYKNNTNDLKKSNHINKSLEGVSQFQSIPKDINYLGESIIGEGTDFIDKLSDTNYKINNKESTNHQEYNHLNEMNRALSEIKALNNNANKKEMSEIDDYLSSLLSK